MAFLGNGCHRAQIIYFFGMQRSVGWSRAACARTWSSPESSGSKSLANHGRGDRALPAHAPRPQDVLPDAARAKNADAYWCAGAAAPMNRHTHTQPQKRAARYKRGPRALHTHCRHTTSATRRPAREERTAHTQFKFVRSECAGPKDRGAGDGTVFSMTAAVRTRDGGTVAAREAWNSQSMDGPGGGGHHGRHAARHHLSRTAALRRPNQIKTSRPAGGLVWPDGVKASSMESPDGGTRPTGATEATSAGWFGGRRAVSFGPTAYRRGEGSINGNWIGLSGFPVEQLLDAKTSQISRRRDARRSLRADRPRGESGGDGQAAA